LIFCIFIDDLIKIRNVIYGESFAVLDLPCSQNNHDSFISQNILFARGCYFENLGMPWASPTRRTLNEIDVTY